MGRHLFVLAHGRFLGIVLLSSLLLLTTGCPEGEGGAAEGAAAEAPAAEGSAAGAAGAEGGETGAEAGEASPESGEAIRAAEDTSSGSSHFYLRMSEEGIVRAIDEIGFKSRPVARFDEAGQLWEVDPAGRPLRVVAVVRDGQLLEVNALGQAVKAIGSLRATIRGNVAIDRLPEHEPGVERHRHAPTGRRRRDTGKPLGLAARQRAGRRGGLDQGRHSFRREGKNEGARRPAEFGEE